VEEPVVNAVLAHAHEQYRTDLMAKAVVHADAITGLLVAAALVCPERSAGMKVSSVKKKLTEKAFAPGVNRDEVYGAEETLGLPLDEFIATAIAGLQQVAPEIGLQGLRRQSGRPVKCSDPTAGGGRQPPSQE
jgi:predicted hydrolase (HD superfamily)